MPCKDLHNHYNQLSIRNALSERAVIETVGVVA